ncbi:MAG: diaminohydroxyphosphoribosylaminopyrimidine deaminase / 5-amino-6-(5-phosphoribosylamino)uracil reductase [Candidatus Peregrinibacteria bacterium Greene0416_19]|nr:MAG: diaminohydroxyphosphoribosylaminopyrimidine deaminase / 5-amino-6-(5-phosphoribosylamino)uracil reductase [Candidatus Peregrinibacteria bacterium Greene0416_19]
MRRCLALASRARGLVGNGAMVGAVLVRKGQIIAEAHHAGFGLRHAERSLLESFRGDIHPEDILFTNLEPCCHTGRTPPCTNIIVERGIRKVIYGMRDSDPRVAGKGIALLQSQGLSVTGPVDLAECERLNRGFNAVRTLGRPWITLKMARTLDGRIANGDGSPLKITSTEQDRWSHTWLRSMVDAILIGVQTVMTDDPLLDTRFAQKLNTNTDQYYPLRFILDPSLRIPEYSKILTNSPHQTILVAAEDRAPADRISTLAQRGIRVMLAPLSGQAFDLAALFTLLVTPQSDYHGITSMLVEGGPKTWETFRRAGAVDEDVVLVGDGG